MTPKAKDIILAIAAFNSYTAKNKEDVFKKRAEACGSCPFTTMLDVVGNNSIMILRHKCTAKFCTRSIDQKIVNLNEICPEGKW